MQRGPTYYIFKAKDQPAYVFYRRARFGSGMNYFFRIFGLEFGVEKDWIGSDRV